MPVEIESCTVSHFKATINAKVEPEGLESDGIFISYLARPGVIFSFRLLQLVTLRTMPLVALFNKKLWAIVTCKSGNSINNC